MDYDKLLENMPISLTKIEQARYIYIQLGKYFNYDEKYITAKTIEEKQEIFDRDINYIKNSDVVCTSMARIYENLLKRAYINAKTVLIPPKDENDRLGHGFTEIDIDGKIYYAGLVEDLMNIKTGFKTKAFMNNNPSRSYNEFAELSEEELKRIDDKIGYTYKRFIYGRFYTRVTTRNVYVR